MGNRSFLYVMPANNDCQGTQIAEANNNFPTLWQLLLANGLASEAITDQRVFGDANTDNLAADAEAAMDRLKQLAEKISTHPRLHEQPLLTLQFEALLTHLREEIDSIKAETSGAVIFSANLDELSWLESKSPEEFIEGCQLECNQRWQQISNAITSDRYADLDEALGLQEYGQGFETWHAWAWSFGFSGIDHDYFSMADKPQELPFSEFKPAPKDWENHLEGEYERFAENGQWGIRRHNEQTGLIEVVLKPEWEGISWATTGGVWLERDGLFAYARLQPSEITLAFEPQLDEVWNFFEGEDLCGAHCAIVRQGDLQGILNADGTWLLPPSVDELWGFANGYAPFRSGTQFGFINHEGKIVIPAIHDDVSSFSPSGLAPFWKKSRVGLMNTSGSIILPPAYEEIEWREDVRGFSLVSEGKTGLANAAGEIWISPQYDEIKVLLTRCQLAARLGNLWGMLDWRGVAITPIRFHDIETRYFDDMGFEDEPFSLLAPYHKQCIVRIEKQSGLIDANGEILIPIQYDAIESLMPQTMTMATQRQTYQQHLAIVIQRGARRRKLRGVYDIDSQQEIIPCVWHYLLDSQFDDQHWGFLVGMDVPKADRDRLGDVRTGILSAKGEEIFPPEYAWIGKAISINGDGWLTAMLRKSIYETWSTGKPLQAVPNESGEYVWLYLDGRVEKHIDYLHNCFSETGDLNVALELGRAYRDGTGVDVDAMLARHWLWKATGAIEKSSSPSLWKKIAKTLKASSGNPDRTPSPEESPYPRHPSAMYELALLLQSDLGGPEQADTAREWLRFALQHGGATDGNILTELGYLLSEGIGGKEDRIEGKSYYEKAIQYNASVAMHNLGLAYQYGRGVEIDLPMALDYFRQAERTGDESCAFHTGTVLMEEAFELTGNARRKKYSEAAYAFSKIIHKNIEHSESACFSYAKICLDPETKEYNPRLAEETLLLAANLDDIACITSLIEDIYGNPESPLKHPEQQAYWEERKATLLAEMNP
ncbi:SEL1-like repeat protein [Leeia sp. TBRC 13508]|uniref:SEL1-like repeat protein n=1 Tax=Leeia speluncae TaxID=2884804 RepID=A0ABS8D9B9_9NEIS|nr:SEL1-like repeat protein [Leeia speluncae]MCB6184712.1 SEL1-like repeat protein [Leeia speluncae]